jgi:hypothetical protein
VKSFQIDNHQYFKTFLSAYISCTEEVHYDISIYAYNVPWLDLPPPSFSLIPFPTLNNFNRFHCSVFIQIHKVHQPYSPFLFTLPARTSTFPLTRPVLYSRPSFFKCISFIQGFGCGISHMTMLYFNCIKHPLLLSLSLSPHPPSTQ